MDWPKARSRMLQILSRAAEALTYGRIAPGGWDHADARGSEMHGAAQQPSTSSSTALKRKPGAECGGAGAPALHSQLDTRNPVPESVLGTDSESAEQAWKERPVRIARGATGYLAATETQPAMPGIRRIRLVY